MKVLILAAGYGTRLYSLVKDTPKALLEINNKPLINHILDRIENIDGLDEVVLITNNKFFSAFEAWAAKQSSFAYPITVISDKTETPEERLGSIGDMQFALSEGQINDDVLVIASDNLFDYNINEYMSFAKKKAPSISIGLYDIEDLEVAKKFGVVSLDDNHRIIAFKEKPAQPQSTLVAMCFYYLPKNSLELINEYLKETEKSDTAGDYIRWLHEKGDVYGFKFTGKWYDIGSVEAYKDAQENFK